MHQVVVIEKHLPSSIFWPNLIKDKRIEKLSVEEILKKYQGFEGGLISIFQIKENKVKMEEITDECMKLKNLGDCLLLHVLSEGESFNSLLKKQTIHVGYDVGVCDEEKTIYSSIFHEILFGHLDELIAYKDVLNENLLFSDRSTAEKYVALHDELSAQGKGVEDYEKMTIYEIWKHKD